MPALFRFCRSMRLNRAEAFFSSRELRVDIHDPEGQETRFQDFPEARDGGAREVGFPSLSSVALAGA